MAPSEGQQETPAGAPLKRLPASGPGGFVLGAPGTFVASDGGRVVIGHRPRAFHGAVLALLAAVAVPAAALFWAASPLLSILLVALFVLPPSLALLNHQRFELGPTHLALRGRALGRLVSQEFPLPAGAVRVAAAPEFEPEALPRFLVQVRTDRGWVSMAEAGLEGPAQEFAERVARATGLPRV